MCLECRADETSILRSGASYAAWVTQTNGRANKDAKRRGVRGRMLPGVLRAAIDGNVMTVYNSGRQLLCWLSLHPLVPLLRRLNQGSLDCLRAGFYRRVRTPAEARAGPHLDGDSAFSHVWFNNVHPSGEVLSVAPFNAMFESVARLAVAFAGKLAVGAFVLDPNHPDHRAALVRKVAFERLDVGGSQRASMIAFHTTYEAETDALREGAIWEFQNGPTLADIIIDSIVHGQARDVQQLGLPPQPRDRLLELALILVTENPRCAHSGQHFVYTRGNRLVPNVERWNIVSGHRRHNTCLITQMCQVSGFGLDGGLSTAALATIILGASPHGGHVQVASGSILLYALEQARTLLR